MATTQTVEVLRAGVQLGGRALDTPAWQANRDTLMRHQIYPYPCPSALVLDRSLSWALDPAPMFSCTPCTPCTGRRPLSAACMAPYPTHSTQPGVVLLCLLVASSCIRCPFERPPCYVSLHQAFP